MNSRERTYRALEHSVGDRIPIDFWATPTVYTHLEQALGMSRPQILDRYDVDLRYIAGPAYIGPPLAEGTDIWGVTRSAVAAGARGGTEAYSEVTRPPLASAETVDDVESYGHWPSPDWFDYSVVESQCDAGLAAGRVVVFMGDRLNRVAQLKPAMYLRGTSEILTDVAVREELAHAVFRKIRDFYMAYLTRILEAANGKIDIVLTGDDFGCQHGLLISPEMWRAFLRPGFADYLQLVRSHGAVTMHHTCGSVTPIIPDMIDCGLDVLQSIQPEAAGMSLAELKQAFGDRLCFHGGISIQRTMPYGSADDVRRQVKAITDVVGTDGGYIFCTSHNIQADTPVENIVALMEAYLEFGRL